MRIRTLKPEFWSSISIGRLSLGARLTFIGLWNYADDEGRGVFDPRLIRAALWPLEDATTKQVTGYLREIADQRLIIVYEDSGRTYFAVPSWKEHQSISKPKPSRLPAPSETSPGLFSDTSETSPRGKGREQGTGNREAHLRFDEFWNIYPVKKGRAPAEKAWAKAVKATDPDIIIAGAILYRDDPNRDPLKSKWAQGWLNDRRWEDEPAQAPRPSQPDPSSWSPQERAIHAESERLRREMINGAA